MPAKPEAPTAIDRILARFQGAQREYVSGIHSDAADSIDDRAYGDPLADTRPDFVREDERGWRQLVRLG
jgi:hypothetical protein